MNLAASSANAASVEGATTQIESAKAAGLVYVSDTRLGIRLHRAGKGFAYLNTNGKSLRDATALARIWGLAIPPAYTDVWISADPHRNDQTIVRAMRWGWLPAIR